MADQKHHLTQHVQFAEETVEDGHNADIQVQVISQLQVHVHLGFLKVRHRYEVVFNFECPESMENVFDLQTCSVPGHVRVIDLKAIKTSGESGNTLHTVTAHLYAYKEKLLKEKVFLQSKSQRTQSLTFVFFGRVLGQGKGTPFLKQGIKCIGFELDDEDDNADMQPI